MHGFLQVTDFQYTHWLIHLDVLDVFECDSMMNIYNKNPILKILNAYRKHKTEHWFWI